MARIPARIEALGLIRSVESNGGFGAVLHRGEPDAGTLLVVLTENGVNSRAYERMADVDGARKWHCAKQQDVEKPSEFGEYLERRSRQDPDLWIIELDIPHG